MNDTTQKDIMNGVIAFKADEFLAKTYIINVFKKLFERTIFVKKCISVFLSVASVFLSLTAPVNALQVHEPRIISTEYTTNDVVIADIVVTDDLYRADATGEKDCSAVIQKAIDDCASAGGGTVFMPVGKYRLKGSIYIRKFVTLRGDRQDPDEGNDYGTMIIADVESTDSMNPALITIGASAGAVGLTVWYPNQTIENVLPYPYTFYVVGNDDYMLQTLANCTLINSYRGIGASSECENGIRQCHEMFLIENVKGTCLYEGLNSYNSADVDTLKTLYILPDYWVNAGNSYNAPDMEELREYTVSHTYGMVLGDLEWPEYCDIKISGCLYGIRFRKGFRYSYSGSFFDLKITDCKYGIYANDDVFAVRGKEWGIAVFNGVIEGSEKAVYDKNKSALMFTNVKVIGKIDAVNLTAENCAEEIKPDLKRNYKKPTAILYTVETDKTGKTDASADVQNALDLASATGGIVYLPGGLYRFENPVKVPADVELRGSSSVPARCQSGNSGGTLILAFCGYSPDSPALISLESGSGLNGIRIDYLKNNPVDNSGNYSRTSPAVFGKGNDIHITNCCITLASLGIRLEESSCCIVKKIVGCCYESMFNFSGCDDIFVEGCLQNANAVTRNGYSNYDIPEMQNRIQESNIFKYIFIPITRKNTDYFTLKNCTDITLLNTFIYGGRKYMKAENSTVTAVNIGSDGSSKTEPTMDLTGGRIIVVNSMRSTEDGKNTVNYVSVSNGAEIKSYNNQAVDVFFRERNIYRNISLFEIAEDGIKNVIFRPFYLIALLFGRIVTAIKQS